MSYGTKKITVRAVLEKSGQRTFGRGVIDLHLAVLKKIVRSTEAVLKAGKDKPYSVETPCSGCSGASVLCLFGRTEHNCINKEYELYMVVYLVAEHSLLTSNFKVLPEFKLLILKHNYYSNVNKSMSSTRWTTLNIKTRVG